ncbi:uncharacterized protein G2W53_026833 [Senna tora]|uniref:Uncharacterized protein n=1 Tax=Senna tora TaxID=362788 RepID=A0A834TFZ8_9FABA|nr:uncharacterized protein G2W53_026833 [Senna tora]
MENARHTYLKLSQGKRILAIDEKRSMKSTICSSKKWSPEAMRAPSMADLFSVSLHNSLMIHVSASATFVLADRSSRKRG